MSPTDTLAAPASEHTATGPASPTVVDLTTRSTLHGIHDLAAAIGLRRLTTTTDEGTGRDGAVIRRAAALAVIRNPWAGTATGAPLGTAHERTAPILAKILTDRLHVALGGPDEIQAFGKAAVVGSHGEIEHASALIHTAYFGNIMREALEGTSILCFADGASTPGDAIRVPLWHKTAAATRDFYQTIEVPLIDAPHADELVVIAAASCGPRPYARIGDRSTDRPVTSEILKGMQL